MAATGEQPTNDTTQQSSKTNGDTSASLTEAQVDSTESSTEQDVSKTEDKPNDATTEKAPEQRPEEVKKAGTRDKSDSKQRRQREKNKSSYDSLPESKDPDEIRKQVEFYFSDANLPHDQYLLNATGGPENKPVPLKTIHNFKRMKRFQPYSAVREAVAASEVLNLDDKDEITRKVPLDKQFGTDSAENARITDDSTIAQSAYVKGFGEEYATLQLDLEEFFKTYGPVNAVRMRRANNGAFKGSVFVEFETEELKSKFLEDKSRPKWTPSDPATKEKIGSDGVELLVKDKKQYLAEKEEEHKGSDAKPRPSNDRSNAKDKRGGGRGGRGRDRDRGRGGRGRNDRGRKAGGDNWKERRDRDQGNDKKRKAEDVAEPAAKKQKAGDE